MTRTLIVASGCAGLWIGTQLQVPLIVIGTLGAIGTTLWGLADWLKHRYSD